MLNRSVDGRLLAVFLLTAMIAHGPAYSASHTIECHAIRFHKSVMTNISVDEERNWRLHLSDGRLLKSEHRVINVKIYLGRRGRKAYDFPIQVNEKNLRIELGRNRDFIAKLRKFRWIGYQLNEKQKIIRVRITDARKTIDELITNCEGK
ncbi:MAG: hypothetical protein ACR2OW_09655 [Methyloligellaceae bacterium]